MNTIGKGIALAGCLIFLGFAPHPSAVAYNLVVFLTFFLVLSLIGD